MALRGGAARGAAFAGGGGSSAGAARAECSHTPAAMRTATPSARAYSWSEATSRESGPIDTRMLVSLARVRILLTRRNQAPALGCRAHLPPHGSPTARRAHGHAHRGRAWTRGFHTRRRVPRTAPYPPPPTLMTHTRVEAATTPQPHTWHDARRREAGAYDAGK